jgi:membrane-associated phospholipid phosphatase
VTTVKRGVLFLTAALALAAAERPACAEEVHELKKELAVDLAFTGTALTFVLGLELAKADLAPKEPRWSDINPPDEAARNLVRWKSPKIAAGISDLILVFFAPGTALATLGIAANDADAPKKTPTDGLLVLEATAASELLNEVVKYTVARERPYGHYPTPLEPAPTADARLSFYSGHTSTTFSLAAASGTVAYLRGYDLAPLAWIPGAALAAFTGYLRVAADKHYFTDVLAGAIVGSAVGILVPLVFHPRVEGAPAPPTGAPSTSQAFSIGSAF